MLHNPAKSFANACMGDRSGIGLFEQELIKLKIML